MKRSNLPDVIAFLLILMFSYAAFVKLFNFGSFRIQMRLQPVPAWSAGLLIYTVPVSELLTVSCLLFKATRTIGFYVSAALMLAFSVYVGLAMTGTFGDIPCSCGGVISHLSWPQHLVFNLAFLLLSVFGIVADHKERRWIGR